MLAIAALTEGAIFLVRQEALHDSLSGLRGDLIPQAITMKLETETMKDMQQQSSILLRKTLDDGLEVEYTCPRMAGESMAAWRKRCREEFKEWCEEFEEGEGGE